MNRNPKAENDRLTLAYDLARGLTEVVKTSVVVGSLAYGDVNDDSDLDLLLLVDPKKSLDLLNVDFGGNKVFDRGVLSLFNQRALDIFRVSFDYQVPVDLTVWSTEFFERLVADLRPFEVRSGGQNAGIVHRDRELSLHNLHGEPKSISARPSQVVKNTTAYPAHFVENDFYWSGVFEENLLATPWVVRGDSEYFERGVNALVGNLLDRSKKERVELSVSNLLFCRNRLPVGTVKEIVRRVNRVKESGD